MPILYYRILLFSCIPIAGFLLYKGIRLMRRSFAGRFSGMKIPRFLER